MALRCKPGQMAIVMRHPTAEQPEEIVGMVVRVVEIDTKHTTPISVATYGPYWGVEERVLSDGRTLRAVADCILLPINDPDLEKEINEELVKEKEHA